ncbi:hypothetical protein H3N89_gp28 [Microbacterium phage MonChoix]|uniref:Uncharacterized protein n=1 Tax=Microbacterium phage MonChoix TaxID=2590880 RepID=A0A4Y6EBJ6_9CAUD|nr:hypothetical protein H3N89_gp28 [Microbacterium phage MonChoix]QDF15993.1 hypothetical protein SEA_MONCHOIX_28 [Microbacterium phage MonChoix]
MHIIIGYSKGEAFVVGHIGTQYAGSRRRAEEWVEQHPHGINDEFDYVEIQVSHSL